MEEGAIHGVPHELCLHPHILHTENNEPLGIIVIHWAILVPNSFGKRRRTIHHL